MERLEEGHQRSRGIFGFQIPGIPLPYKHLEMPYSLVLNSTRITSLDPESKCLGGGTGHSCGYPR